MRIQQSGFTLLEIVFAGIVLCILASFAIPNYQSHVLRSHRALAKTTLSDLAAQQESAFLRQGHYATDFSSLVGSDHTNSQHFFIDKRGHISKQLDHGASIYKVELLNSTPTFFMLRATAVGHQTRDKACLKFGLTSLGQRSSGSSTDEESKTCW